jgi:hypothetical protein
MKLCLKTEHSIDAEKKVETGLWKTMDLPMISKTVDEVLLMKVALGKRRLCEARQMAITCETGR